MRYSGTRYSGACRRDDVSEWRLMEGPMMNRLSRFVSAVVVSGAVGLVAAQTAHADPAFGPSYSGGNCPGGLTCTHWCPGDPLIPGSQVITWDWNSCHDWYWNSEGVV